MHLGVCGSCGPRRCAGGGTRHRVGDVRRRRNRAGRGVRHNICGFGFRRNRRGRELHNVGTSGSDQSSASSAPAAEPSSRSPPEPSKDKTDPADEAGAGSETADDATSAPSSDATDPEPTQEPETTDDAGVTARHSGATPAPTAEQTAVARQDTGWDADDEVAVHGTPRRATMHGNRIRIPHRSPSSSTTRPRPVFSARISLWKSDDSMQQAAQQVTVARAELITVDDSTSTGQPAVPYQQGTLSGSARVDRPRDRVHVLQQAAHGDHHDSSLTVQTDAGQVTGAVKGPTPTVTR